MSKLLKTIGAVLVGIWLSGAVISFYLDEIARKKDCIHSEGVLRGLFWCSTDSWDRDGGYLKGVIRGLRWPFSLLTARVEEAALTEAPPAEEKLNNYMNIFERCRREGISSPAVEKECVIRESNKLEGKRTYAEASCHRKASVYESFAMARDSGISLNVALEAIDRRGPELGEQLSNAAGVQSNKEEMIEGAKQVMRYVYAHPNKSPSSLQQDLYSACLSEMAAH